MINQLLCSLDCNLRDDFYNSEIACNEVIKHFSKRELSRWGEKCLQNCFLQNCAISSKQFIASVISLFFCAH